MTAEIRNKDLGGLREALPAQRVSRDLRGLDVIIQLLKYALVGVANTFIDASAAIPDMRREIVLKKPDEVFVLHRSTLRVKIKGYNEDPTQA